MLINKTLYMKFKQRLHPQMTIFRTLSDTAVYVLRFLITTYANLRVVLYQRVSSPLQDRLILSYFIAHFLLLWFILPSAIFAPTVAIASDIVISAHKPAVFTHIP